MHPLDRRRMGRVQHAQTHQNGGDGRLCGVDPMDERGHLARQRAVRGVEDLAQAMPAMARRFTDWPAAQTEAVPVVRLVVGCEVVVCSGRRIPVSRSFGICWRVTSERAVVLCGQVSARAVVCGLVCVCGCELLCVECVGGARSAGIAGVA